jgi:murein DD-endopeptidase MepM/ murein hydrolase activator NlpD
MDGIGGMIIGNMFKINNDVLPSGYKGGKGVAGAKIGYVVTGLGHKINNNDWTTQVDSQFVVLDEPQGLDKKNIKTVQAINRAVTSTPPGRLSGSLAGAPPPSGSVSALGFGLPLASPYNIGSFLTRATSKTYNTPVTVGSDPNHQGLDMQGPNGGAKEITKSAIVGGLGTSGDGIFSVQAGKVIKAEGGVRGFGNWVYIHHTIGGKLYTSIYGHMALNSILVRAGDTVTRGQQIASVGTEGTSTGYHLHFELWEGDRSKLLDPMDYLPFFKANGGNIPDTKIVTAGRYS